MTDESYNPSGRQRRREVQQVQEECSPYVLMPEILEKLKLLSYEQQFLRKKFELFKKINSFFF
jgi:hypothetical protein